MHRICWLLVLLPLASCNVDTGVRGIPVAQYEDKVAGFWLGQLVGNIYGLSHEFQYLDDHGPTDFPLGYGEALERAVELDGAFSDDDTDLEYMYLLQMDRFVFVTTTDLSAAVSPTVFRIRLRIVCRRSDTEYLSYRLPD